MHDSEKECIFESRLDNFTSLSNTTRTMGLEEAILADVKRQGIEQGIKQNQKQMIKQLLLKNFSSEEINEMLGCPLTLILKVQEEVER